MKKLFKTSVDLPENIRKQVCAVLQQQLVNLVDLQLQLKQSHWNVKGAHFYSLHKLFEDLAEGLDRQIDAIAERITALGGLASGGARQVAATSELKDLPLATIKDKTLLAALQQRFKAAASSARKAVGILDDLDDDGTEDMLIELSQVLDKGAWFIDSSVS